MFSVCLCSWNDLEYLKILVRGLKRNTRLPYELIVHDNGSEDETEQWLKENGIKYTRTPTNEGVAAVNYAVKEAKYDFIVDINADMYPLPGWDLAVLKQIQKFKKEGVEKFTISACLIEPTGDNPEYTIRNHGDKAPLFNEESLLKDFSENATRFAKADVIQYSHPVMMPKKLWQEFGGVDTTYFPGYASDHDIPACAYKVGCRNFIMLGNCRVYHFVSKTLEKLPPNLRGKSGLDIFQNKWGMSVDEFRRKLGVTQPYGKVPDGIFSR